MDVAYVLKIYPYKEKKPKQKQNLLEMRTELFCFFSSRVCLKISKDMWEIFINNHCSG